MLVKGSLIVTKRNVPLEFGTRVDPDPTRRKTAALVISEGSRIVLNKKYYSIL